MRYLAASQAIISGMVSHGSNLRGHKTCKSHTPGLSRIVAGTLGTAATNCSDRTPYIKLQAKLQGEWATRCITSLRNLPEDVQLILGMPKDFSGNREPEEINKSCVSVIIQAIISCSY